MYWLVEAMPEIYQKMSTRLAAWEKETGVAKWSK